MPSSVPQSVIDQITKTKGVVQSATALISTFKSKLETAVNEALSNGATAAELEPVTTALADFATHSDELAAAVAANP